MHGSRWIFNLFHNILFMKQFFLKVHSSSIEPKTWIIAILTNFIYSDSLWLKIASIDTFCQSLAIGFNLLSSRKIASTLWTIVILKKNIWQSRFWINSKIDTTLSQSPTSQGTLKVCFNILKWIWKISSTSIGFLAQNWG